MLDLRKFSTNLEIDPHGIWVARQAAPVDYPEGGNAFCYAVEEGSYWFNHRNAFIIEALRRYPPGGEIFDIGGGNGFVSLALRKAGFVTVLVEPGIEGIQNARQRGLDNLVQATLQEAGFRLHSLPAAGLFDVLEHIPQDIDFLRNIAQLLVPGGLLYLTVPAYSFLWSSEDDYAGHARRYSLVQLKNLLAEAGYAIELATYFFMFLIFPIFFLRTLPSKLGWRTRGDTSFTEAELKPPSPFVNRCIEWILSSELSTFKRWNSLPFGGSCLVVARTSSNIEPSSISTQENTP